MNQPTEQDYAQASELLRREIINGLFDENDLRHAIAQALCDEREQVWEQAIEVVRGIGRNIDDGEQSNEFHALLFEVMEALEVAAKQPSVQRRRIADVIARDPECEKCEMGVPMSCYGCPENCPHLPSCVCKGTKQVFKCDICNPPEAFKNYAPDGREWWD